MKLRTLIISSLVGLSLAACNAGSTLPTTTATATATSVPTTAPFSAVTQSVTAPANTATQLASAGGFTPTITLPVAAAGTSTISQSVPTGLSTFDVNGPVAIQGQRAAQSKPGNATTLAYVAFTPTSAFTIPAQGAITLTSAIPSSIATGTAFYLALFDGTKWHTEYTVTPGTVSGTTVSFSFTMSSAFTFNAGTVYGAVLYAVPSSATPSSATLSATSTPGAIATATPTATATSTPSTSATAFPTSGMVSLTTSSQTLSNITSADGTTASLTIPGLSAATITYSTTTTAAGLTSSTITGTTGTFLAGATLSSSAAITVPNGSVFSYTVTPSSVTAGKTGRLYLVASNGAATMIGDAITLPAAGTSMTVNATTSGGAFSVPASTNYMLAFYGQ